MNEEFLHYIWKYRLFGHSDLRTQDGAPLQIIRPGEHNRDAGPDFFNARMRIGPTVWAGNVEIHVRSSEWEKHGHSSDKAYDNILLHVVYEHDAEVFRKNKEKIPVLELKGRLDRRVYARYLDFKLSRSAVPCGRLIGTVPPLQVSSWLDRMLAERLERRSADILQRLALSKNNWEETFYLLMARNFGFKVNAEAFEQLAGSLPYRVVSKCRQNRMRAEALLFGQAGLLEGKFREAYPRGLQKEYAHLRKKFGLKPMDAHIWRFLRLRPVNFPTIRLSQFAGLLTGPGHLFSRVLEVKNAKELRGLLSVEASDYWLDHFLFGRRSPKRSRRLGDEAIDNVIINTIAPLLFVYGRYKKEDLYCERALSLLERTDAEDNAIVRKWAELGIKVKDAYRSQALIELRNEYCAHKKCLDCGIGSRILS
ncbi:MAG: DUF2851 family protein [Bacteroidota bacterium]